MNALIIQTAFLGDAILTTPMFAAFKRFFPDAKLSAILRPDAAQLLTDNPHLNEIISFDKKKKHGGLGGLNRLTAEIRSRGFDVILSPHSSHRTGALVYRSKVKDRYGYADAGFARFAYNHKLKRKSELPEIKRLLQFLADSIAPGAEHEKTDLILVESPESKIQAETLLKKYEAMRPVLLAPSSVWPTKRWTPYGFAELAGKIVRKYKCRVLLVGSPGDAQICELVMQFVRDMQPEFVQEKVHNVAGETSLRGLYSLVKKSRLLISNDSAPVHYGCAAKIPVVALFGPTVPALGYAPITKNSKVSQIDLACRPCGTHGANVCPLDHFRCMKELSAEQVFQDTCKLLDSQES